MTPDPFNFPANWDQIVIGGMPWGGVAGSGVLDPSFPMYAKIVVEGATRFYKVDQKDGQGLDGATQTFRGVKPKPFRLKFFWYTAAQHQWWTVFSYQFIYTGSKKLGPPPVFAVSHPALDLLSISAILIDEVGQVNVDVNTKEASAVVTVRQFYPTPPSSATATPVAAPPNPPAPGVSVAPTSEAQIALAQIAVNASVANAGLPGALPF